MNKIDNTKAIDNLVEGKTDKELLESLVDSVSRNGVLVDWITDIYTKWTNMDISVATDMAIIKAISKFVNERRGNEAVKRGIEKAKESR